jgi:hypothetical protein
VSRRWRIRLVLYGIHAAGLAFRFNLAFREAKRRDCPDLVFAPTPQPAIDFRDATVVVLFLLPDMNVKLVSKHNKPRPGTPIVSYEFAIEGVASTRRVSVPIKDGDSRPVYLWTVPLERAGPGS